MSHRTARRWSTGSEHRVHQRRDRTDRVIAWPACVAHHENLNRAQPAQCHAQFKILVRFLHRGFQHSRHLAILQASHYDWSYIWKHDLASRVHNKTADKIELAPDI